MLDFDDTFLPGIAHLSAPVAPAALALGAHEGATVGDVLAAYADGFEAMGALAAAGHPALYDRGWHPTAVCGAVGAAVAAARLLGADAETAAALAALRAGGLRAAFGSDGKSIQVGLAAATGVAAARLAKAGATVPADPIAAAWEDAYGGAGPPRPQDAVARNWIKAWPCCLQTHGAIECAERVGAPPDGPITVLAHPVSRQAASYDAVETPLQAKFSIPYTTAFTLLHGGPRVDDFAALDARDPEPRRAHHRPHRRRARGVGVRAARRRRGARARRRRPRLAAAPALPRASSKPRSTTSPAIASTTSPTTSRPPS